MKTYGLLFLVFFGITACHRQEKNNTVSDQLIPENRPIASDTASSSGVQNEVSTDTIAALKKLGLEILNGRDLSEIDEDKLYELIDLISIPDESERGFYLRVFNFLRENTGGYFRESISGTCVKFCNTYPNYFFTLDSTIINSYAIEIGELFRTEEEFPAEAAKDFIMDLRSKCDSAHFAALEDFTNIVFDKVGVKD